MDTNAYTAFKRNHADAVEIIRHTPFIALNSVILGELLGGFAVGSRERFNQSELNEFLSIEKVSCLGVDTETARYYARVYRCLRSKGNPIPTNDMWIAATALQYDLTLFSYDKHFQAIDGLFVGSCLADFVIDSQR
ncbi:type II toxin-antitoxin system VapC family toxin [Picosynechococcus sp. PCC 8807]|uniref:type II toxin-antitoxin system VapC family toxin n=1 Tax=Picosynechococcus sp. PCC 8807 TaxID=195248 RepID=UPI001E427B86|nr:type II toxin-antitoxin system VapC family toxin [Picosynechococcus sp. PCC 8807]